jgi:hypothetical protein
MPRDWSTLAEASDVYEAADFQNAAYQLLCSQVLYESEHRHRVSYQLIAAYRPAFTEAFDLFGMQLRFNDPFRYCYAIPHATKQTALPLQDTLLMLVLCKLWHERAKRGELDDGTAVISIEELQESYRAETGRELPSQAGQLRELIERVKRFGAAKTIKNEDDSTQPFDIVILPGIEVLVSEVALAKLTAHVATATLAAKGAGTAAPVPTQEEADDEAA